MKIGKTIKEMDLDFANGAGLTYGEFKSLSLMDQSAIKRKQINKKLKSQK